jgi:hypothetical protein
VIFSLASLGNMRGAVICSMGECLLRVCVQSSSWRLSGKRRGRQAAAPPWQWRLECTSCRLEAGQAKAFQTLTETGRYFNVSDESDMAVISAMYLNTA